MSELKLTFASVYRAISEYLGLGSAPAGTDLIKVQDLTMRGYRRFLMPIDASDGKTYRWKFLERTTTLSIEANTDTYTLPDGFSSFITPLTYITPMAINPQQMSLQFIYEQKSYTTGTAYPLYYALKVGDFEEISNGKTEIVFWPTPSNPVTYYYTYVFIPPKPVEDDDCFVGDDFASEAILECCLAVAENNKYDTPSNPNLRVHAKEADRLVQALIGKDKRDNLVPFLGMLKDGKDFKYVYSSTVYDENGTQVLPAP